MNVADLELCKELYELSGWFDTYFFWDADNGVAEKSEALLMHPTKNCPAYDLGYLLRKLPAKIMGKNNMLIFLSLSHSGSEWWANYETGGNSRAEIQMSADTPEDALTKLAIELFKQGVLNPPSKANSKGVEE